MIPVIFILLIFLAGPVNGQSVSILHKDTGIDLSGLTGHPLSVVRRGIAGARLALTDYYWSRQYIRMEETGIGMLCHASPDSSGEVKVNHDGGPGLVRPDSSDGWQRLQYFFTRDQVVPVKVLMSRRDSTALVLLSTDPLSSLNSQCEFFSDGSGRVTIRDGRLLIYELIWQSTRFGSVRVRSRSGIWSEEPFVW